MAEIPKQGSGEVSSLGIPCSLRSVEPPPLKSTTSDGLMGSQIGRESFLNVCLNMGEACRQFNACDTLQESIPKVQGSLSYKGWCGGERKAQQPDDEFTKSYRASSMDEKCESVVVPISRTIEGSCPQMMMGECRVRRSRRRWLDSKRVFMIFASLSSMGTLMLIYFTLSMGKINGDHAQA